MIRLLIAENIPIKLDSILSAKGWDVQRVPSGMSDEEIADLSKREKRVIITQDKHFADIRVYAPKDFCGIVRLRFSPPLIPDIASSLEKLFSTFPPQEISGKLIVLRKDKIQIR